MLFLISWASMSARASSMRSPQRKAPNGLIRSSLDG